jgi:hypothetical protein
LIFEKLDTVKTPTQDFSVLAELHCDLHGLLAGAGQVSTEYLKTKYLADALKHDPAGLYAIEIFYRSFPAIPDRTFEDLVEILTLHAPTFIATNSTLGYSNAMATTASALLAAPLMDAAGHAQIIAKHQKELAALNKKNGVAPRPRSSPKTTGGTSIVTSTVIRRATSAPTAMSSRPTRRSSIRRSTSQPRTT